MNLFTRVALKIYFFFYNLISNITGNQRIINKKIRTGAIIIGFSSLMLGKHAKAQDDSLTVIMCYVIVISKPKHSITANIDKDFNLERTYFSGGIGFNKLISSNSFYILNTGLDIKYEDFGKVLKIISTGANIDTYFPKAEFVFIYPGIHLQYHYGLLPTQKIIDKIKYQSYSIGFGLQHARYYNYRFELAIMYNHNIANLTSIPEYTITPSLRFIYIIKR